MSTTKTYKEKLQLLLNTKTQFKNDIINAGGTIDNSTPFSSYPAIYKTLKGGAPDGTAVEINTPEGMAEAITESNIGKFYKYIGPSTAEYNTGDLYIVQDLDNPLVDECSGGSAAIQGYMPTPVPNSGLVEKLVFNTELTTSVVDTIISNANLTFVDFEGTPVYPIFVNEANEIGIVIVNFGTVLEDGTIGYVIMNFASSTIIYSSSTIASLSQIDGWNFDLFEQLGGGNEFPVNMEANSSFMGLPVGNQNEAIKDIINCGSSELYYKELSETYTPVIININDNVDIDLTAYMDNKEMPIKVNKVTSSIDSNIKPENIKLGVNILGVTGTYTEAVYINNDELIDVSSYCYKGIESLISFSAPKLKSIGSHSFQSCSNLKSVTLPSTLTSIGGFAFSDCTSLESIVIPEGVTTIAMCMVSMCSNLKSVTLPSTLTIIDSYAFHHCISLKNISLPASLRSLQTGAFEECTSLESIVIPEGVTIIQNATFESCSNLKSVTLPSTVTSINYRSFMNCTSLESIVIPEGVTTIGQLAFCYCDNLKTVVIKNETTVIRVYIGFSEISSGIFEGTKIASGEGYIYVPDTLLDAYKVHEHLSVHANQFRPLSEYVE